MTVINKLNNNNIVDCSQLIISPVSAVYNLFSLFKQAVLDAKCLFIASKIKDIEGKIDASLNLATQHLSIGNTTASTLICARNSLAALFSDKILKSLSLTQLTSAIGALGFSIATLEVFLQSLNLNRTKKLYDSLNFSVHSNILDSDPRKEILILNDLEILKKTYFSLSPKDLKELDLEIKTIFKDIEPDKIWLKKEELTEHIFKKKMAQLARRVQPWMATEIKNKLSKLIRLISSSDPVKKLQGLKESQELLKTLDIQLKKTMTYQILAIIAAALSFIGIIFTFIACPYLIPVIFFVIGILFETGKKFHSNGYLHTKGWNFHTSNCFPNWMNFVYQKLFVKAVTKPYAFKPHRFHTPPCELERALKAATRIKGFGRIPSTALTQRRRTHISSPLTLDHYHKSSIPPHPLRLLNQRFYALGKKNLTYNM